MTDMAFIDLAAQRRRLGDRVDRAIARVLDHGGFIMGPEVAALEQQLRAFCDARHAVTCSNGTDALMLALMALEVGPGDAVLCPSFTFAATAEAIACVGAVPVFVDVLADSFMLDAAAMEAGVAAATAAGATPRGVITVDLFGQPADYDTISTAARELGLWILADAAQSFGATYRNRSVGTLGLITTTSFFPAKPLGCYGDGGAIFTDDDDLAARLKSLRVHGQGSDKYDNVLIGMNGRIDTIQAAVLLEKLAVFPEEIIARQRVAQRYAERLPDLVTLPAVAPGSSSVWAQYTMVLPVDRDHVAAQMKDAGIPTAVYYRKPLHRQKAYQRYPTAGAGLPMSDSLAARVLSLPMHPYLDEDTQDRIIAAVQAAVA